MKAVAGSSQITAGFDLIDLDDPANNLSFALARGADIFDGKLWTQTEFVAVRVVPVPAALPLLVSAIALAGLFGRRDHGYRG